MLLFDDIDMVAGLADRYQSCAGHLLTTTGHHGEARSLYGQAARMLDLAATTPDTDIIGISCPPWLDHMICVLVCEYPDCGMRVFGLLDMKDDKDVDRRPMDCFPDWQIWDGESWEHVFCPRHFTRQPLHSGFELCTPVNTHPLEPLAECRDRMGAVLAGGSWQWVPTGYKVIPDPVDDEEDSGKGLTNERQG
ncbi:hypothetical protein [Bifidobacterium animalis]|uniref:hypothetical protein n=1 Tax=Bifidobacterium animalis TaxID=28025 RepID=UPI001C3EFD6F|nr:hypothetical protein [Bifidobacterium animalis]